MERLLAEVTVEKTHATKYAKTTRRVGSMIPFGKMVERYGVAYDKEEAIVLATRCCAKAVALGEGWVGVDTMAECPLFYHVEHSDMKEMSEAWELLER